MKSIVIGLIFAAYISMCACSQETHIIKTNKKLIDEEKQYVVHFNTRIEAYVVQKRIGNNCYTPARAGKTLILWEEQLLCTKINILGNEIGFIRDIYRDQINEQMKY